MTASAPTGFSRATPVLRTGDYARARAFYADKLGFVLDEEGGDPARFGIFRRGTAVVFVDGWHGPPTNGAAGWNVYIHVDDVDGLCAELAAAGVEVLRGPAETVYGMYEIDIRDPDGNLICFGQDADR